MKKEQLASIGLSTVISLISITLGWYLSEQSYNKHFLLDQKSQILQKRIELVERTTKILYQTTGIEDLGNKYLTKIHFDPITNKISSDDLLLSEKLSNYYGDYVSVLELDQIFFGPETKKSITTLLAEKEPFWAKTKEKNDAVIAAMTNELYGQ